MPEDVKAPKTNIEGYQCLYLTENALRELIIEKLQDLDGPRWYKLRLPPDVLDKYRLARTTQRKTRWTSQTFHHPVYYLDFPDLKKTIETDRNWDSAFRTIFKRKDLLSADLSQIEEIRNAVAHNRTITEHDLQVLVGTKDKLMTLLGKSSFEDFASRATKVTGVLERLKSLESEGQKALQAVLAFEPLSKFEFISTTCREWWFDESYLGKSVAGIADFCSLMEEYASLPRYRGTGHKIEDWVKAHDVQEKYRVLQETIKLHVD